jgi:molybdate transport system substrate-binding protein
MRVGVFVAAVAGVLLTGIAQAAEIKVASTQATEEAYKELVALFERQTGHKVTTFFSGTINVAKKLADGEPFDLVIMSATAIDEQTKLGKVAPGSKVNFASSGTGLAVKKGAPKPDISTPEALKKTLLAAKSIGYSTGPSGVYVVGMFDKMGIGAEVKDKLRQTPSGVFVGTLIAKGDVEVGFQQISELVHFDGIDYVGPLPGELQRVTMFSAGLHANAKETEAAKALVRFLTAPAAAPVIRKHGLEPG